MANVFVYKKGEFNKTTTYQLEPKDVAKAYQQAGAEFIHVVRFRWC
ncbi:hypothetical protein ACP8HZ_03710 [Francisella noatunensis]